MAIQEASARKQHALRLFAPLSRHYDRVGAALSFGQDPRWRRAMVEAVRASPSDRVLDVATGTGLVAQALVRRWGCSVVGVDQSAQMLAAAQRRLNGDPRLADRVTLVRGEAERLPFDDREFDHLTFTYLLRYVDDPAATLRELARVVSPGGRIACLEFGMPPLPALRSLWSLYTRFGLPALGRLVSPEWGETGRFLSWSIPDFYLRLPLEEQVRIWHDCGIVDVHVRLMSFGAGVVMWGTRAAGVAGLGAGASGGERGEGG